MDSKLYLFALSCFPNPKGFCNRTILMRGKDEMDARSAVMHKLRKENSRDFVGEAKGVNYD